MNISKIKDAVAQDEVGVVTTIYQKNGDPYVAADGTTPSTLTLVGNESKRYKAAKHAITRRLIAARRTQRTPEDIQEDRIAQAVAAVIDWAGWEDNGQPAAFTPDNVRALIVEDHILEQVEEAIKGHASFFKNSSKP